MAAAAAQQTHALFDWLIAVAAAPMCYPLLLLPLSHVGFSLDASQVLDVSTLTRFDSILLSISLEPFRTVHERIIRNLDPPLSPSSSPLEVCCFWRAIVYCVFGI